MVVTEGEVAAWPQVLALGQRKNSEFQPAAKKRSAVPVDEALGEPDVDKANLVWNQPVKTVKTVKTVKVQKEKQASRLGVSAQKERQQPAPKETPQHWQRAEPEPRLN
jgi:hypothetical protein